VSRSGVPTTESEKDGSEAFLRVLFEPTPAAGATAVAAAASFLNDDRNELSVKTV